jgi:hypothetical protein
MKVALALLVAFAFISAGPATAQAPAPAPGGQPQQQPQAEPGKNPNLKLEDPELSSRPRIRFGPAEQDAGGLPSLGDDARRIEQTPRSDARTSPYPSDTNPGR